jgi:hypothetical protein
MLMLAITGYKAYPLVMLTACPFIPVTKEVPALAVGAAFEIDSFKEPSNDQCPFRFAAPTSFELLNPPIGAGGAIVFFFLQAVIKTPNKTNEQIPRVTPFKIFFINNKNLKD